MTDTSENQYFGRDLEAMSSAVNYHGWICDEFAQFIGKRVAEVGAGTGCVSKLVLEKGVTDLHAYEPSSNMFPVLASRLSSFSNVTLHHCFFGDGPKVDAFDSILYVNVLEHIEDDIAELERAYQALAPGGHLLIFVPALQWLYSRLDQQVGHFRRYHRQTLKAAVQSAGFSVKRLHYFDVAGILPWLVYFKWMKNTVVSDNVKTYDQYVVPIMRRLEGIVRPPIGKNLLLVATRPE